jgi:hypothetical protein
VVRSTYFIFLSHFIMGLIRTFFALWINKKRVFITHLFYSNKFYMELLAEEKKDLIVFHPISNFGKKKPEFSSFLLTLKKEYN